MTRPTEARPPRALRRAAWLAAAVLAFGPAAGAQAGPAKGQAGTEPAAPGLQSRFDDLGLTLEFPAAMQATRQGDPTDPQLRASWTGTLGGSALRVQLLVLPIRTFGFVEPHEVIELIGSDLADADHGGDPAFRFESIEQLPGSYGYAGYATLARSTEKEKDGTAEVLRLAGLLPDWGYAVVVRAQPALADADLATVREFLVRGVRYDGEVRDPKWSKAEAEQRWRESVPEDLADELDDVLRTPHYIVLTNSSGGKSFGKKMEECYAAIRKVYPFDEVAERRLMPVFLFRTNDQYYQFLGKQFGMSVEDARRTGGISSGDFYSTWYEAPGDPVHIHEATHQIFRNRLGLGGAGSWFQEGVAEYMSTRDNERGMAAHAVEKGKHVPLPEFVKIESLIFSQPGNDARGADTSGDQYKQAALFVEFLRESKFGKAKFQEWLHAVGAMPSNDVPAIEAAVRRVYGTDLAGLEKEFVAYCKKR
jgi:hypothetical protein